MVEPINDDDSAANLDPGTGADGFAVTVTVHDNILVLGVSGTLDLVTAPRLTDSIQQELTKQPAVVIVDLTEVEFLASAGMTVLLTAHQQIGDTAQFAVVADGPAVARPLRLIGVDKLVTIHATLDAALQASSEA